MVSKNPSLLASASPGDADRDLLRSGFLDDAEPLAEEDSDTSLERIASKEEQGLRLDRWLASWPELESRAAAQRLLEQQRVWLNQDLVQSPARKLKAGDSVQLWLPAPIPLELEPEEGPLEIMYEDEHLLVLNKPAGLVIHPAPGHPTGTLVQRLLHHCQDLSGIGGIKRPGIVHRIDKDTSGLLVIAKHDRAHQRLARQFKKHTIHRQYSALIWGNLPTLQGTINAPIGRHPRERRQMAIVEDGREALTHWQQVNRWEGLTHIYCQLETGRTHQIRVHFSAHGHPLIGDPLYGKLGKTKHMPPVVQQALQEFPRQALHAAELGFEHPITGEFLEFTVPEPEDFQTLLELLETHFPPSSHPT